MSESAQRLAWRQYDGASSSMVEIDFAGTRFKVAEPTVDAWRALEAVLAAHDYDVRPEHTFGYGPRNVKGTHTRSLHAFGIAIDVNSTTNPDKPTRTRRKVRFSSRATQAQRGAETGRGERDADTDMTPEMIADVRAIRTRGGERLFGWGGDWTSKKDAMHFHIDVAPAEMKTGVDWQTVKGVSHSDDDVEGAWAEDEDADDWAPWTDQWGGDDWEDGRMNGSENVERYRPLLELIAEKEVRADGPHDGYNTSLGNGKYLSGGERELTSLTLSKIRQLQKEILSKHGKSSAIGRYQIVGITLKRLIEKHKIPLSTLYSEKLQDQLAVSLIEERVARAKGSEAELVRQLGLEWEGLKRFSDRREIMAAYNKRGAATGSRLPVPPGGPIPGNWLEIIIGELRKQGWYGPGFPEDEARVVLKLGDRDPIDGQSLVANLQRALSDRNYSVGKIDGIFGSMTAGAVAAFQKDAGVRTDLIGSVDTETWDRLAGAASRPLFASRTDASASDLRATGSRTIANADNTRLVGWITSVFGALGIGNSAINNVPFSGLSQNDPAVAALAKLRELKAARKAVADAIDNARTLDPEFVNIISTGVQKVNFDKIISNINSSPTSGILKNVSQTLEQQDFFPRIAEVASYIFPPFGGSLAALALGIAAHIFGSRIIDRRVRAYRTGTDMSRLNT